MAIITAYPSIAKSICAVWSVEDGIVKYRIDIRQGGEFIASARGSTLEEAEEEADEIIRKAKEIRATLCDDPQS